MTDAQLASLELGRAVGAPQGGRAVIGKMAPDVCPRCGLDMSGRVWHSYLGHLGLHGLADAHFDGDIEAAQARLRENGLARQDPFPGNGAFAAYRPVMAGKG
jgi:hypothetical protein